MGCAYNNLKALTVYTVNKLLAYANIVRSSCFSRTHHRAAVAFFHVRGKKSCPIDLLHAIDDAGNR